MKKVKNEIIMNKENYLFLSEVQSINNCLMNCVNNFIEIGFRLQEIKNNKSYAGFYDSFENFCKSEFSLGITSVKNYIAVANKFGDKESLELQEKYEDYSLSQLVELLPVSDDIDNYDPNLTIKEIRTKKYISQLSDYKEKVFAFVKNYFETNKKDLEEKYFSLKIVYYEFYSIYIYRNESYLSFFSIILRDGNYSIKQYNNGEIIYDLTLENFTKIFNEVLIKSFEEEVKNIKVEKEEQLKLKEEENKNLPENNPDISFEERQKLFKERIAKEKRESLFKDLKKFRKYYFGNVAYFYAQNIVTFKLFTLFTRLDFSDFDCLYYYRDTSFDNQFCGLINGISHYRFYNDRIEKFEIEKGIFVEVISFTLLSCLFHDIFKNKINFDILVSKHFYNDTEKKQNYLCDLEYMFELFDDKKSFVYQHEKKIN